MLERFVGEIHIQLRPVEMVGLRRLTWWIAAPVACAKAGDSVKGKEELAVVVRMSGA